MAGLPRWKPSSRLAHGWLLMEPGSASEGVVRYLIRPAVRAVPSSMALRLGPCRISIGPLSERRVTSHWTESETGLAVFVTTTDLADHDIAMDLLLCLGQALWGRLKAHELRAYWRLLGREIEEGVTGEIDEQALEEKRASDGSRLSVEPYGLASFAGTAAEYVHCLWHDVTIRTGPEHLPAPQLRRRLKLLARWFPPDRGYRLFPAQRASSRRAESSHSRVR